MSMRRLNRFPYTHYLMHSRKCGDELNEITLRFFKIKGRKKIIREYKRS